MDGGGLSFLGVPHLAGGPQRSDLRVGHHFRHGPHRSNGNVGSAVDTRGIYLPSGAIFDLVVLYHAIVPLVKLLERI